MIEKHEVTDDRGRLIGSFLSVRDNTAEQETLQQEMFKATHDSLTDVYNRAGYDLLMSNLDYKKVVLLLIDGDMFKTVNDTYGHETGDRVLQKIAGTLRHSFRSEDYVCRIGGDEFIVLMAHHEEHPNEQIAKRFRKINETLKSGDDGLPPVTVSIGVAYGRRAANAEELFEHADRALYEAKREGKHRFVFYDDMQSAEQRRNGAF